MLRFSGAAIGWEMKKVKSDDDRVSELPESVIFLILSFMGMRDVVKTSLLSKRWKDLWMTTPYLCFDDKVVRSLVIESRNFINRALLLWDGSKILKFKVTWTSSQYASLSLDLDLWLRFAAGKKVQEIDLKFLPTVASVVTIQSFQSCSSLQKLSLINCNVVVGRAVQWSRLTCLTLSTLSPVGQDVIDKVVRGSPRLENFDLDVPVHHRCMSIQSGSLKRLSLCSRAHNASNSTGLEIRAPRLEALVIQGAPPSMCLLMNVPSLSQVTLDFTFSFGIGAFKLSPGGFKMLLGQGMSSLNAKVLRVRDAPCQLVVELLQIFPKLETLAIDLNQSPELSQADILFMPFFMQLTTVEITWYTYGASMFQVIECLLKHAPNLANMVIKNGMERAPILAKMVIINGMAVRVRSAEDAKLVAQKLLTLQRSFHAVSLNIL